ncbi:MAG TPA: sortase [Actinomycetota bacterium]
MAPRRRSLRGILAVVLIAAGAGALAYPSLAYAASSLRQRRLADEAKTLRGGIAAAATDNRIASSVVAFRPDEGQPLGVIRIPRLNIEAVFFEGVGEETLLAGPGHLPWTALPGSDGVSVLAAHRDMHFRSLKDVHAGERVVLDLPDGRIRYRIVGRAVAHPQDSWVTRARAEPVLRLVTCWPPNFIGPAPDRLIVSAVPLDGEARRKGNGSKSIARSVTLSATDASPFSPSSLPSAGAAGAAIAALAAFGAIRFKKRAVGFIGWFGGSGVVVLTLLAAWAGPALSARVHVALSAERRPAPHALQLSSMAAEGNALTKVGNGLARCHHAVLAIPALSAFVAAEHQLGFEIPVASSFRTHEQQALLHWSKPRLAAPSGSSLHERGLAIDVPMEFVGAHPDAVLALERFGFRRFRPRGEPWHFSFVVAG